jgi:hypothetical protein
MNPAAPVTITVNIYAAKALTQSQQGKNLGKAKPADPSELAVIQSGAQSRRPTEGRLNKTT